jgi:chromosome segregation ATPase
MHCEARIRELEEQLRELQDERDEWCDRAEEWKQRAYDYESERDIALEERNEAQDRVRELEEELGRIKPKYEALLTILQEELGHLESLVARADWEQATEQIAHIRRRYHAAIAVYALQNQNTT